MNPLTAANNIKKLSERELKKTFQKSWHDQYRNSSWIFIGGLPYDLSEGDIICVFSQFGEVVNINLIRDKHSGKSKGFCFLCYEDQRSTDLAVDNLNAVKILNRTIRVDHVEEYQPPKKHENIDPEVLRLYEEGCAPKLVPVEKPFIRSQTPDLPIKVENIKQEIKEESLTPEKKRRKPKNIGKKRTRSVSSSSTSSSSTSSSSASSLSSSSSSLSSSSLSSSSSNSSSSNSSTSTTYSKRRKQKNSKTLRNHKQLKKSNK